MIDYEDMPAIERIKPLSGKKHSARQLKLYHSWCNGKHIYKTKEMAQKLLDRQLALKKATFLRIYKCPEGGHYHLTSSNGKRRKKK